MNKQAFDNLKRFIESMKPSIITLSKQMASMRVKKENLND